ncbi:MAG: toll/interleukin-1 receptor domain-containing protein [Cyanobacteria bacterium P01_F01_bin.33]
MPDETDRKLAPRDKMIFISYTRHDADAADSLEKVCRQIGAETFVDRQIQPGESLTEKIDQAINRSNVLIVLVSKESLSDSPLHSIEWSAICERKWKVPEVRIFPICLDKSEPPVFLSDLEILDGSDNEKLASCANYIIEFKTFENTIKPQPASDEQHKETEKRFQELSDAIRRHISRIADTPMKGPQS